MHTEILAFINDGSYLSLNLKWLSPTQLEVQYNRSEPGLITFQAIKFADIDISVRNLANDPIESHPVVWSAMARSADGARLATANTTIYHGSGTDVEQTTVEIKMTGEFSDTTAVLYFHKNGASMDLKMRWSSPTHLEVEYKEDPSLLYFQVAKALGVEISVRNLLTNPDNES